MKFATFQTARLKAYRFRQNLSICISSFSPFSSSYFTVHSLKDHSGPEYLEYIFSRSLIKTITRENWDKLSVQFSIVIPKNSDSVVLSWISHFVIGRDLKSDVYARSSIGDWNQIFALDFSQNLTILYRFHLFLSANCWLCVCAELYDYWLTNQVLDLAFFKWYRTFNIKEIGKYVIYSNWLGLSPAQAIIDTANITSCLG